MATSVGYELTKARPIVIGSRGTKYKLAIAAMLKNLEIFRVNSCFLSTHRHCESLFLRRALRWTATMLAPKMG
jgi:hypothetical protein